MSLPLLALLPFLDAPLIEVQSAGDCPTAAAVRDAIQSLLIPGPPAPRLRPSATARVEAGDGHLGIVLRRADGTLLAERSMDATGACDVLAATAAVVIVVWESDVRRGLVPTMAPLEGTPAEVALVPPRRRVFEAGLGIAAWLGGEEVAPAALVQASLSPLTRGWSATAALSGASSQIPSLGPGSATWRRWSVSAGPGHRWLLGPLTADVMLQLAAAVLQVRGRGYPLSFSDSALDPGLIAGARLSRAESHAMLWVGFDVTGHLHDRIAHVEGLAETWRFPRVDAQFVVGASYRFDR